MQSRDSGSDFIPSGDLLEGIAIDLALGQETEASLPAAWPQVPANQWAALLASPALRARVEENQALIRTSRTELADWQASTPALTGRILASLSEDAPSPGLRGDFQLVRNYLRERLRDSIWVRLAAASFLVHLIAVPAVAAYVLWKAPQKREVIIHFLPPQETLVEEVRVAPEEELVTEDLGVWHSLGLEAENAQAVARYALRSAAAIESEVQKPGTLPIAWQARLRLVKRAPEAWLPVPEVATPDLGHVLTLELALDSFALRGDTAEVVTALCGPVWRLAKDRDDAAGWLALASLVRARAYDLFPVPVDFAQRASELPEPFAGLRDAVRPGAPIDPLWMDLYHQVVGLAAQDATLTPAPVWAVYWQGL
ncbi:MAG: hypothetical protein R3F17_09910 [Planctomycetota bacterium]